MGMSSTKRIVIDTPTAEAIAIKALAFIAADDTLLPRFLALTGLEPAQLRIAAAEPGFLPGVLDFVLGHEPTLQQFCVAEDIAPAHVPAALEALAGDNRLAE